MAGDFRLHCVADAGERAVMLSASRQLAGCVSAALGHDWTLALDLAAPDDPVPAGAHVVVSLRGALLSGDPMETIAADWNRRVAALVAAGHPVVMLTIYRHVADSRHAALVARCRRINMLVVDLSHRHGVEVADVDRAFSLAGAASAGSDYRCTGGVATRLAGHAVAAAVLALDLEPHLPAGVQAKALAAHAYIGDRLDHAGGTGA